MFRYKFSGNILVSCLSSCARSGPALVIVRACVLDIVDYIPDAFVFLNYRKRFSPGDDFTREVSSLRAIRRSIRARPVAATASTATAEVDSDTVAAATAGAAEVDSATAPSAVEAAEVPLLPLRAKAAARRAVPSKAPTAGDERLCRRSSSRH